MPDVLLRLTNPRTIVLGATQILDPTVYIPSFKSGRRERTQ